MYGGGPQIFKDILIFLRFQFHELSGNFLSRVLHRLNTTEKRDTNFETKTKEHERRSTSPDTPYH